MTVQFQLTYTYTLTQVSNGQQIGSEITNSGTQLITDVSLANSDLNTLATAAGTDMSTWLQANAANQFQIDTTRD